MIESAAFRVLLSTFAAGALGAGSAVALARFAGPPAPVVPLKRLTGWDLAFAGALYAGLQSVAGRFLSRAGLELGLVQALLLALVAGFLTWCYLGLREGSFAPRRQPVQGRKLSGARTAVLCYLLALPGLIAVRYWNGILVEAVSGKAPVQSVVAGLEGLSAGSLALSLLLAILVLPLLEEALFRGYLWRFLAGRADFGPRRALAFSSLVFAMAHEPQVWLPVFYLGGLFGWVYWRSGRLRYALLCHALHNGLAALILFLPGDPTHGLF